MVPDRPSHSDARPWLAFAACGSIWGSTFLVISIGNDTLAPVWAATLRLMFATVLLTTWMLARGDRVPRGGALRAALGYGVCQFGINFPLLYWGERVVPSGVAAVFYATIPLSSALIAYLLKMERLTARKVIGAAISFAGVVGLFSSSFRGEIALRGMVAIFIGALSSGVGTILLKRGPRQSPIGANAVGCAIGVVMAFAVSVALREPRALPANGASAFSLIYLTVAGSLGAFVIMSWLVNHWPITRTSYITVIVPVIALALGTAVRHERLTFVGVGGSVTVLLGLLIGMRHAD